MNHGVIRQDCDCQRWYIRHVYILVYFHVFVSAGLTIVAIATGPRFWGPHGLR